MHEVSHKGICDSGYTWIPAILRPDRQRLLVSADDEDGAAADRDVSNRAHLVMSPSYDIETDADVAHPSRLEYSQPGDGCE
eukprot:scaffold762_cov363-Pavlova_lutheri.AAC.35